MNGIVVQHFVRSLSFIISIHYKSTLEHFHWKSVQSKISKSKVVVFVSGRFICAAFPASGLQCVPYSRMKIWFSSCAENRRAISACLAIKCIYRGNVINFVFLSRRAEKSKTNNDVKALRSHTHLVPHTNHFLRRTIPIPSLLLSYLSLCFQTLLCFPNFSNRETP